MADSSMEAKAAKVEQSCEKGGPSGPPAVSPDPAGSAGPLAGSKESVQGPLAASAPATPDEQAKLLLQQRRANTLFADWMHSLAPADARRAVLKRADSLASTCTRDQISQLSAILVSDSYGGDATAEMVFKVREAYNTRSLGCKYIFFLFEQ